MLGLFASCEKDLMTYEGINRLGFSDNTYSLTKTFAFDNSSVVKDTVYLNVRTMGHVSKTDRTFKIEQIKDGKYVKGKKIKTAKAGLHFVDFSNTNFVIKANKTKAKIPIVLLRDISMRTNSFGLKVRIVKNNFFELPSTRSLERLIIISDMLEKPKNWYGNTRKDDWRGFGVYGKVKHRFMIDVSGLKFDELFFRSLILNPKDNYYDEVKVRFYRNKFIKALKEYNEKHPANSLREEKKEGQLEGDLVSF
jgi:hypothetical protein